MKFAKGPFSALSAVLGVLLLLSGCSMYGSGARGASNVKLGDADGFVILAKSGVSNSSTTAITGDIGVSPAAESAITGFALTRDSSNEYSTSAQVTGKIYSANLTPPTPANMTAAISAMETAYTDAAGRTHPDETELGAGEIGGLTLAPGLYKWGTGVSISTDVTLSGGGSQYWIFQIGQGLTVASATSVILSGGANAANIIWQVAGSAMLGTTSHVEGIIMSASAITLDTGATVNGALYAQTAVSLDANTVVLP